MKSNDSKPSNQIHIELKSGIAFDITTETAGRDVDTLFLHVQKNFTDEIKDARGVFRALYAVTIIANSIEAALRSSGEDEAVDTIKKLIEENSGKP